MNLDALQKAVNRAVAQCERERINPEEVEVGIRTVMVGTAGYAPTERIEGACMGIDFDRGHFLIKPTVELRKIGLDEIATLREKYEEFCCSTEEVRTLKRKLKKYEEAEKSGK